MKNVLLCFWCCAFVLFYTSSLLSIELLDMSQFREIPCTVMPVPSFSKHYKPHHKKKPHTHSGKKIVAGTSTNWSGYASVTSLTNPLAQSVSRVTGDWTVPTIAKSSRHTYCAIWVGIDGFSSSTVEQIGTEQEWDRGRQINYAWFEMYPGPMYQLVGFPVRVNDKIRGLVQFVKKTSGKDIFQLTLYNLTKRVSFTVPSSYTKSTSSQRNSAEWVVEAPSSSSAILPLAKFSTITLSNCQATIQNRSGPINSPFWKSDGITMKTSNGKIKAQPSTLKSGGTSFSVTWKHE